MSIIDDIEGKGVVRRRSVMKTVGASVSLAGITGVAQSAGSEVEIVTHKKGNKPIVKKKVPEAWLDHTKKARVTKRSIESSYRQRGDVKSFALSSYDETYGGKRGFQIIVKVTSDQAKRVIPDRKNGIQIKTISYENPNPTGLACHGGSKYDYLPGGVAIENETQTTGSMFHADLNGDGSVSKHLLTCAHGFGDECGDDLTGSVVQHQGDDWGGSESTEWYK